MMMSTCSHNSFDTFLLISRPIILTLLGEHMTWRHICFAIIYNHDILGNSGMPRIHVFLIGRVLYMYMISAFTLLDVPDYESITIL